MSDISDPLAAGSRQLAVDERGRKGGAAALAPIPLPEPRAQSPEPHELLQQIWGYTRFRPGQERIIRRALAGESTLAVMPTGMGKSLCFQLPSLLLPGVTLVVSPLIALMQDQRDGMPPELRGATVTLTYSQDPIDIEARLQGIARGLYRMVYVAPERLRQRGFIHALQRAGVSLVVVDEAHCISLWGHDFRPDYRFIGEVLPALGGPPVLAMTATATTQMQAEIASRLGDDLEIVNLGVYRPNLQLSVIGVETEREKWSRLLALCRDGAGSILIYVPTRAGTEKVSAFLTADGLPADHYHAGLDPDSRTAAQTAFMRGETRILAATIAFGMGIDKPDIRHILHFGLPGSLETYHQEIGRAGRDGMPARCVLLFSEHDRVWSADKASESLAPEEVFAVLAAAGDLLAGDEIAIHPDDLERETQLSETSIRAALGVLEEVGALRRGFDIPRVLSVMVRDAAADAEFAAFVERAHLREYQRLAVETRELSERAGIPPDALEEQLLTWADHGWLEVRPSSRALQLTLTEKRETANDDRRTPDPSDPSGDPQAGTPSDRVAPIEAATTRMAQEGRQRFQTLFAYLYTRECRHALIGRYFDGPLAEPCGHCDNCAGRTRTAARPVAAPEADRQHAPRVLACLGNLLQAPSRAALIRLLLGADALPDSGERPDGFGALSPLGVAGVASLLDDLLRRGLIIERRHLLGGTLHLTQAGRLALAPSSGDETYDERAVLEQLRAWRQAQARAERRLPLFVLSNATLRCIARERPRTLPALMALPGLGVERARAYGDDLLQILWPSSM